MLIKQRIDTETRYKPDLYINLPDQQEIEDPEQEVVLKQNPPAKTVGREPYQPDPELTEAVNLAITLRRPLLLQGDPGCGKTRLAYALAYALGIPLEECYIKSTTRAQDLLYIYDAVGRLYDAQLGTDGPRDAQGEMKCRKPDNYVRLGPLGRAIVRASYGRPSIVLIDEIDKADLDFPNDLLRELDRLEFAVSEAPGMKFNAGTDINHWPIVIVTHNEEKALPTAFLRRCIFHVLRFPKDALQLLEILKLHQIRETALAAKGVEILLRLHKIDFNKQPGISELLDWISYLDIQGMSPTDIEHVPAYGALLKEQGDQERFKAIWNKKF